jgi:drug/metabolite transporter (DMT)-like permease
MGARVTETNERLAPSRRAGLLAAIGPELALLLVMALWASTFIVTKDTIEQIRPLAFIAVRFLLMTVLAVGVMVVGARHDRKTLRIRRADIPHFALASLTGFTLYQLGFVFGVQHTSAFSAALLIALIPVHTLIILALRHERTPPFAWVGVGIALAGVVVFLLDKRGSGGNALLGDGLSLAAGLSFAIYGLVNRPLVQRYPPAIYTAYSLLFGAVPLVLIGIPATLTQDWGAVSAGAWLAIIYMVIFPVYLAYMLFNWAISRRGAAEASSFTLLEPVFSGILSALIFHEAFGATKLAGAALVLAGLAAMRKQ